MSDTSSLPNLLILGAPRCGTTSLHDWIEAHPDVAAPSIKELFYFADADSFERVDGRNVHEQGLAGYEALFAPCRDAAVRMESTTGYLYYETALQWLPQLASKPKFVVVVREPASRLLSTYRYFIGHKGYLPEGWSFARFIEGIDQRDEAIAGNEFLRDAFEQGGYAAALERWTQAVGRDRIRVVTLGSLMKMPETVVPALVEWAGADAAFYENYDWPHRNESYTIARPGLHRWVRRQIVARISSERVKRALRPLYIRLAGGGQPTEDPTIEPTMQQLKQRYADDNRRLAEEWAIDVGAWSV